MSGEHSHHSKKIDAPSPIIQRMRWPFPIIWIVPLCAAIVAGYYLYQRAKDRGPIITIHLLNAAGVKAGETTVQHRGVEVGKVESIMLSDDQKQVLAEVRLQKNAEAFEKSGAMFWVVRPEISTQNISGLETITSGPYIDSSPGSGKIQGDFTALPRAPASLGEGLKIVLHAPRLEHLQYDSPVFFRGVQVGVIRDIELSADSSGVDIHVSIRQRYRSLVRTNSRFWVLTAVDVKGGVLSGVQVKLDSLSALISGGLTFATPDNPLGDEVPEGADFPLYNTPKDEWKDWSPKIDLPPDEINATDTTSELPQTSKAVRSAVK